MGRADSEMLGYLLEQIQLHKLELPELEPAVITAAQKPGLRPKAVEVIAHYSSLSKGGIGFLFWNANNDYSKPYTAMPEMRAAKGQYFRGDEVGA